MAVKLFLTRDKSLSNARPNNVIDKYSKEELCIYIHCGVKIYGTYETTDLVESKDRFSFDTRMYYLDKFLQFTDVGARQEQVDTQIESLKWHIYFK